MPLLISLIVLVVCFAGPLYQLAVFAAHSSLYSHILLIPFISGYLVWQKRTALAGQGTFRGAGLAGVVLALAPLVLYWTRVGVPRQPEVDDLLFLTTLSFVLFVMTACFVFLERQVLRALAFPLAFLLFMVPFPGAVRDGIETFFQHFSADAAHLLLAVTGTPYVRDGLQFRVPGITFKVAQECSGIHSSLVLFITGFLAGHLLLRTTWKKVFLGLFVIPLGILRNGFRIFTLAQLCIHISPDMINSPIHHRGGPIFFGLSLIPFFLVLVWLRRTDYRRKPVSVPAPETPVAKPG